MKNDIFRYFEKKNINVSFNTLGSTDRLVKLFIKENIDIVHKQYNRPSNVVKHQCYSRYYKIEERPKFTGFEKLDTLDKKLRLKMEKHVLGLSGMFETKDTPSKYIFGTYLEELKNSFKKFKNPLLYLSGGIDSEFVALAMLDANIDFTPVIFQWVDDNNTIYNIHDILYAIDFCNSHVLTPIIRKVNIEKLWNNPEFELLAKETNISSPQINTYVYMIESMAEEYKNSTHVLGGEVRFKNQYDVNENKFVNLVLAAKVPASSLGYNGLTYVNTQNSNYTTMNTNNLRIDLTYNWDGDYANSQTWQINGAVGVDLPSSNFGTTNTVTGGPTSGNWFTGPDLPGGAGFQISTDNGATWPIQFLPGVPVTVRVVDKFTQATGETSTSSTTAYTIKIRAINDPGNVITSTITFTNTYNYVPTLTAFTVGSGTGWTRPNSLITTASVFGGGGGGGGGAARRTGNGGGENWAAAAGGGGSGGWGKVENVILSSTTPQITFLVASGGAAGTGAPHTSGGDGGGTNITVKSSTGDVTLGITGGFGGQKNALIDPAFGLFGAGGASADAAYSGGTGSNNGNTIDEAYGGGGGGLASAGSTPQGAPATVFFLYKGSNFTTINFGGGGDGGSASLSSTTGVGASPTAFGQGGGGGGVLVNNLFTDYANGGEGGDGVVYVYF